MCIFECSSYIISSIIKCVSFSIKKEHIIILIQSINLSLMKIFFESKTSKTEYSYYPNFIIIFSYILLSILWFIYNKKTLKEKKILIEKSLIIINENSKPIGELDVNKAFLPQITMKNKIKMGIILYFISFFSPFTYYILKDKFQVQIDGKYICFSLLICLFYSKKYLHKKLYIRYWFPCLIFVITSFFLSLNNGYYHELIYIFIFFIAYGFETILFHYYMSNKYVKVNIISLFQSLSFLSLEILKIYFLTGKSSENFLYFELKIIVHENMIVTIFNIILIILYYFLNNLTIYFLNPGNNIFPIIIKQFLEITNKNDSYKKDLFLTITGLLCQLFFNELIIIDFTLLCKKNKNSDINHTIFIDDSKFKDVE